MSADARPGVPGPVLVAGAGLCRVVVCWALLAGLLAAVPAGLPVGTAAAQSTVDCATAGSDGSYEVPDEWSLKPSSVGYGGKFRLLFLTSTTTNSTSADIATYNTFVQSRAKAGHAAISDACGDLFKAVASTSAVDARANTDTESGDTAASIWWLGGAKAADDYTDFYDGSWDDQSSRNESGSSGWTIAWTGSNADGTKHANPLGTSPARYGQPLSSGNALSAGNSLNTETYPLYALSPVFTVEIVGVLHRRHRRVL